MNGELVQLILWAPFLIVLAVYGTLYAISGYNKGVYRSLISVGATVVAGLVSAILAFMISPGVTDSLYGFIKGEAATGNDYYEKIATLFAKSLIQSVVALFVFSVCIFIFSIIFKIIASCITKNKFAPPTKRNRWGGLAIRLAEAVIFSLILLLPFYGTLATYAPVAESLYTYSVMSGQNNGGGENDTLLSVISSVNGNFLVNLTKAKPIQAIYNGLSGSNVDNVSMNVPEMVTACDGIVERVNVISKLDPEEQPEAIEELVDHIEVTLVGKEWVYELYLTVKDEILLSVEDSVDQLSPTEKEIFEEFSSSLNISKKDFNVCFKEGISFLKYVFKSGILEQTQKEGFEISVLFEGDFLDELGDLINCNNAVLPLKKLVWLINLSSCFETPDEAVGFLNKYPQKLHNDKEEKRNEALALLISFKQTDLYVFEAMVRHPDFGFDSIKDYLTPYTFANLIYITDRNDPNNPVVTYLNQNPDIYNELVNKLKECEYTQFSGEYFREYASKKMHELMPDMGLSFSSSWQGNFDYDISSVPQENGGYSIYYFG